MIIIIIIIHLGFLPINQWMFNDTKAQNKIGYWVSNKWYLRKKVKIIYVYT